MGWVDRDSFWVWNSPQRSDEWIRARKYRVTASDFGVAAGHSLKFSNPEQLAMIKSGQMKACFTEKQLQNMNRGTQLEDTAREWYERTFQASTVETGLAVPKWDLRLGASTDGEVLSIKGEKVNGCIEIKCPQTMYQPLAKKTIGVTLPHCWKNLRDPNWAKRFGHLWPSHFDQMQGTMAILRKEWCDYVVYCPHENTAYTERIPFEKDYWEIELYPNLKIFLEHELAPRLSPELTRLDPPSTGVIPLAKH